MARGAADSLSVVCPVDRRLSTVHCERRCSSGPSTLGLARLQPPARATCLGKKWMLGDGGTMRTQRACALALITIRMHNNMHACITRWPLRHAAHTHNTTNIQSCLEGLLLCVCFVVVVQWSVVRELCYCCVAAVLLLSCAVASTQQGLTSVSKWRLLPCGQVAEVHQPALARNQGSL